MKLTLFQIILFIGLTSSVINAGRDEAEQQIKEIKQMTQNIHQSQKEESFSRNYSLSRAQSPLDLSKSTSNQSQTQTTEKSDVKESYETALIPFCTGVAIFTMLILIASIPVLDILLYGIGIGIAGGSMGYGLYKAHKTYNTNKKLKTEQLVTLGTIKENKKTQ